MINANNDASKIGTEILRSDYRPHSSLAFGEMREIESNFTGSSAAAKIENHSAMPISAAADDFDEDGMPDLVTGYSGDGGNLIMVNRGNPDAVYPDTRAANERKASGEFTDIPLFPQALAIDIPDRPELLGTGDFNADGHRDVVFTAFASQKLVWLPGDGSGRFDQAETVELPGGVTAMTVGEFNRPDGLAEVLVGVGPGLESATSRILVFEGPEGAFRNQPETIYLTAPATSIALGQLDEGYEFDMAVSAGRDLIIVHGRDRRLSLDENQRAKVNPPVIENHEMPFTMTALNTGRFTRDDKEQIAALSEDGILRIIERNTDEKWDRVTDQVSTGWREAEKVEAASAAVTAVMIKARISVDGRDDLIIPDAANGRLRIVTNSAEAWRSRQAADDQSTSKIQEQGPEIGLTTLEIESDSRVVVPMRLNMDAFSDLVMPARGSGIKTALSSPRSTYTVNSAADQSDANPGDGKCETAANNNVCTFRAAVAEVNAGSGGDAITFSVSSINAAGGAYFITKSVTVNGGANRVEFISPQVSVRSGNTTIRGLVLNKISSIAIDIQNNSGGNRIEDNYIGTDKSGANALPGSNPSATGISIAGSSNNKIGGTNLGARNLISPNGYGVSIAATSGNTIEGNFIGTDVDGEKSLETQYGVRTNNSAQTANLTIGGLASGARNVISCARPLGCTNIDLSQMGTLIQGNLIGTDKDGAAAIGSKSVGVQAGQGSGITIGGTAAGAGNIIAGNTSSASSGGIAVTLSPVLIQGNYIGTDVTGSLALGNSTGVLINGTGPNGTIIGGTVTGARNLIAASTNYAIQINQSSDNVVQGNRIGTDVNGTANLGNQSGIGIIGSNNQIGGTTAEASNIVAFTKDGGSGTNGNAILISQGTGNSVRRNSIFGNAKRAISSVASTADKSPVLTGNTFTLSGARANTSFTFEFFTNDACGVAGTEQAKSYISGGNLTLTTDGSGNIPPTQLPAGQNITATANAAGVNTSTISNCVPGTTTPAQISLPSSPLTFNAFAGQPTPTPQSVSLKNTGGSPMNWSAAAATTTGGPWLSVSPTSGTLAAGQTITLNVSVNSNNLFSDLYTGSITVTAPGASNSPAAVAVDLILGCPAERPEGGGRDLTLVDGPCTNNNVPTPIGATSVSELGLRQNGVSNQIAYLLRSKKKADMVLRVFDQNDNRVGSSPTKRIIRPPSDPIPVPTIETFYVPNEIQSNNCHALGGDDTTCGNSISLFPDSKSLYAQSLMIDPDTDNILSRSVKVPYNIVPFKVEFGTDNIFLPGAFQLLDPSSILFSGSSLETSLGIPSGDFIKPAIRVVSGLEDVDKTNSNLQMVLGEVSRTNGYCQPDDRYVRQPKVIWNKRYTFATTKPVAFFVGREAWPAVVVPDDVDIVELRFGIVFPNGLSALSEPVYLPVERIKIRSSNPNSSSATLTPGNLQNFIYKVEYNIARPGTSLITVRTQSISNVENPPEEKTLSSADVGDTGCQEFTFDVQLPEDTKICKLVFQIRPPDPTLLRAKSKQSIYLKFGKPIDVPAGPLNVLTSMGVDIKTSKNLIRRSIQQGRDLSDPVFLFKLASKIIHSPHTADGPGDFERPQESSTDIPDMIAINKYWTFDPPIPADDSFAADLTFHYSASELPDDPNFNEANLKVVSYDPATGTLTRYPTILDLANKTAMAHVENLAPIYSLAVFGPFDKSTLDFPVFQTLPDFGTEVTLVNSSPAEAVLNSQAFAPAGEPYSGTGVTNPSSLTLAGRQQVTRPADQLFNLSLPEATGWIQTRSNNNRVLGYELFGSGDRLDGLDIPQNRYASVVLPDVEYTTKYSTRVHAANASNFLAALTVELRSADGAVVGNYEISLEAKGELIMDFDQMFPAIARPFTGYIVVRSNQQLSAAEILVSDSELVALNSQPLTAAASTPTTLYAARMASDGNTITTRLNLVNPTSSNATVTIRANDKTGAALATPVNITLAAGQQYQRDIAQVFGFTPGVLTQGSLAVESSIRGLTGDVIYSDPAGTKPFRSGFVLEDASAKPATFTRVDNSTGRFTEVYISNPNPQAAVSSLTVYRPDGTQTGVKSIQIPAGGALSDQLSNLVPESIGQSGGYFVVSANQPFSAGAAFGTLNKTMLAAIPGQRLAKLTKTAISDFDGDGRSDIAVWRPSEGNWYWINSSNSTVSAYHFGSTGDQIVPGDYDGDGRTDFAVYRAGTWYILGSAAGFSGIQFGLATDLPAQGDFDGDGKTDIAVFRPSDGTWFLMASTAGFSATQFGTAGDKPVTGDYDGDGKADIAVYRPSEGNWYLLQSTAGFAGVHFGNSTDNVVPGDFDGDGKTDIAVFRSGSPGTWFLLQSSAGFAAITFGTTNDIPVPGDFDGDGKMDVGVFRPSEGIWYLQRSTSGFGAFQFGSAGDKPAPASYVPIQ